MQHLGTTPLATIEDLARYMGSTIEGRPLALHLLRAIEVAGPEDRQKLGTAFPGLYQVWKVWNSFDGLDFPTGKELTECLKLISMENVKLLGE